MYNHNKSNMHVNMKIIVYVTFGRPIDILKLGTYSIDSYLLTLESFLHSYMMMPNQV